jgi:glycerol-3-phosphate dehydrogenase (NAD(P)+)
LQELRAIVEQVGGKPETPLHLAGLGNLITTATSAGSHHHQLGWKLATGETGDISGEGIHALAMVKRYRLFDAVAYPLYSLINDVVQKPVNVAKKFDDYLIRVQQ